MPLTDSEEKLVRDMLATNPLRESAVATLIESNHREVMQAVGEVKVQVQTTNGRVKALELWRAFFAGAMAVMLVGIPLVITVVKFIAEGTK